MDEEDRKLFESLVFKELDSLNYFMTILSDKKQNLSMDKLIMDFAVNYCKQYYNKNYSYKENI